MVFSIVNPFLRDDQKTAMQLGEFDILSAGNFRLMFGESLSEIALTCRLSDIDEFISKVQSVDACFCRHCRGRESQQRTFFKPLNKMSRNVQRIELMCREGIARRLSRHPVYSLPLTQDNSAFVKLGGSSCTLSH